ncbi:MAG TPA: hypothetical protein VMT95_01510 [Candidatus Binatia bacterium]|nr:hypothetical protein [Candidatus Binatia bacterium]
MRYFSMTLHRGVAIAALAVTWAVLNGCSSPTFGPMAKNNAAAAARPSWTSGGYTLTTVNDTNGNNNEITGINLTREIIGNYSNSATSDATWSSYVSSPPYSTFANLIYPAYKEGIYMYAINDAASIMVGYANTPTNESGLWGTVDYNGLWSLTLRHPHELDCKPNATHELLGFDNNSASEIAVGFYTDSTNNCTFRPFELKPGDNRDTTEFKNIPTSWLVTKATGIAPNDDIVGSTQFSYNKAPAGWFQASGATGTPSTYNCCGGSTIYPTAFNGIASVSLLGEVVVGSYVNASITHGLVWIKTTNTWKTVNGPPGTNYTIVNGVNANDDICGWYRDPTTGYQYGFVGTPSAPLRKHHR